MSRGIHLGYPSQLELNSKICSYCFDRRRFLWVFTEDNKVHKVDWFANPSQYDGLPDESEWKLEKVESITVGVKGFNAYSIGDYIWFTPGTFTDDSFSTAYRININTNAVEQIPLPAKMNSNIHYSNGYVWMVSDMVADDHSDTHKVYAINNNTFAPQYATLPGKKQNEKFQIWGNWPTTKVFISLWNSFSFVSGSSSNLNGVLTTTRLNGFPGVGTIGQGNDLYVASFGGMISKVNAVDDTFVSDWACGDFDTDNKVIALAYEWDTDNLWFVTKSGDLGKVNVSTTKEIYDTDSTGQDYGLLAEVLPGTVNSAYTEKKTYSIVGSGFTGLISTPKFTINYINSSNQEVQKTIYPRIIASSGTKLISFNSHDLEFVFDKPEEKFSYVAVSGSAMIGSGDTGYIGEII